MKYKTLVASLLFTGMLILPGCGGSSNNTAAPAQAAAQAQAVNSTTITSTTGEVIKVNKTANGFVFEGYEGKIVLLEVYGDTCPDCVASIPLYNRLQAQYPNDVVVIALESYGTLNNAGQQQYITIPKANTGNMFAYIRDLTGYNLEAVPYLMILSRDGGIVYDSILANFPQNLIDTYIQQLQ